MAHHLRELRCAQLQQQQQLSAGFSSEDSASASFTHHQRVPIPDLPPNASPLDQSAQSVQFYTDLVRIMGQSGFAPAVCDDAVHQWTDYVVIVQPMPDQLHRTLSNLSSALVTTAQKGIMSPLSPGSPCLHRSGYSSARQPSTRPESASQATTSTTTIAVPAELEHCPCAPKEQCLEGGLEREDCMGFLL